MLSIKRFKSIKYLIVVVLFSTGCSTKTDKIPTINQSDQSTSINNISDVREGTSKDTLPTPDDFPLEYNYGTGTMDEWTSSSMYKRLPLPQENKTVLNTLPNVTKIQSLYLWEDGNMPSKTNFTEDMKDILMNIIFAPM